VRAVEPGSGGGTAISIAALMATGDRGDDAGDAIDAAVAQGREAAEAALRGSEVDRPTV
jgi:hypothetical protein